MYFVIRSIESISKVVAFLKNDLIQLATVGGMCIIILALFFKKVLHIPVPPLESSLPGFFFIFYEAVRRKQKSTGRFWARLWFWNTLMLVATGLIILRRLYF